MYGISNMPRSIASTKSPEAIPNRRDKNRYDAEEEEAFAIISDRHVVEEVIDVGKVVMHNHVGEESSSHTRALPKNLIAPLPYRTTRGGVSEAYCLTSRYTLRTRWESGRWQGSGTRRWTHRR
jgi:hypothetical protein